MLLSQIPVLHTLSLYSVLHLVPSINGAFRPVLAQLGVCISYSCYGDVDGVDGGGGAMMMMMMMI